MKYLGLGSHSNGTVTWSIFEVNSEEDRQKSANFLNQKGCNICMFLPETTVNEIVRKWELIRNFPKVTMN